MERLKSLRKRAQDLSEWFETIQKVDQKLIGDTKGMSRSSVRSVPISRRFEADGETSSECLISDSERQLCQRVVAARYNLVLVGAGQEGKSTLGNSIIRKKVLPIGSCHPCIVRATYAEREEARIELVLRVRDKSEVVVLKTYRLFDRKVLRSEAKVRKMVKTYMETDAIISGDGEWKEVVVHYPSNVLKMGIDVYDVPGLDCDHTCSDVLNLFLPSIMPFSSFIFVHKNSSAPDNSRVAHRNLLRSIRTSDLDNILYVQTYSDEALENDYGRVDVDTARQMCEDGESNWRTKLAPTHPTPLKYVAVDPLTEAVELKHFYRHTLGEHISSMICCQWEPLFQRVHSICIEAAEFYSIAWKMLSVVREKDVHRNIRSLLKKIEAEGERYFADVRKAVSCWAGSLHRDLVAYTTELLKPNNTKSFRGKTCRCSSEELYQLLRVYVSSTVSFGFRDMVKKSIIDPLCSHLRICPWKSDEEEEWVSDFVVEKAVRTVQAEVEKRVFPSIKLLDCIISELQNGDPECEDSIKSQLKHEMLRIRKSICKQASREVCERLRELPFRMHIDWRVAVENMDDLFRQSDRLFVVYDAHESEVTSVRSQLHASK